MALEGAHSFSHPAAIQTAAASDGGVPTSERAMLFMKIRLVIQPTGLGCGTRATLGQSVQSQAVIFVQG